MQRETTQEWTEPVSGADEAVVRKVAVVGAHGGAGVTTLAFWLRPARDFGVIRRLGQGVSSWNIHELPVVLVARNTLVAAKRAKDAVSTITWRRGKPVVLAVVSDSLPEPIEATRSFDRLDRRVAAIVRVPFVAALRVTLNLTEVELPKAARDAIAEIRAAALAIGSASGSGIRSGEDEGNASHAGSA